MPSFLALQLEVSSLAASNIKYIVSANAEATQLLPCTCASYVQHSVPCKHLYLVSRMYNDMKICYDGIAVPSQKSSIPTDHCDDGDISDDSGHDLSPRLKAILSPSLVLQLEKARAEKKEAARKARSSERASAFRKCELRLVSLLVIMGDEAKAKKRRKCTLPYFQSTIAGLERTLLKIKGLNTAKAGRTCQ
jgi:hypothetical protein